MARFTGFGTYFTENRGQLDNPDVLYYLHGSVGFTKNSVIFNMRNPGSTTSTVKNAIIVLMFENSNDVNPVGANKLLHKSNYFIGNDPAKWVTNVPSYASIIYSEIYDGIDLIYGMKNGALKYDFVVRPGADPNQIRMSYEEIEGLVLDSEDSLQISTTLGGLHDSKPYIYQDVGETRVEVKGGFRIIDGQRVGFEIETPYESRLPLVIDPIIEWSTFIGSTELDLGYSIAVDTTGDAYITGDTTSINFPTILGSNDTVFNGSSDAFISKLSNDGTQLLYSTFLGGSGGEFGFSIAIDAIGNAYITGETTSIDFPVTPGANDTTLNGSCDAFVVKLSSDGSTLLYSTYLGGNSPVLHEEVGTSIAVDSGESAYVTGYTDSGDFPTTPGANDTIYDGNRDAFVTKLSRDGTTLNYSTFLGGSFEDMGQGIAVDSDGYAYVSGGTKSNLFPTTPGAFNRTHSGQDDIFVTKISKDGSVLNYSTFLGGSKSDIGFSLEVDSDGNAYLTGLTKSDDFPWTSNANDTILGGSQDAFVTKLSSDGSNLLFSSFLGGNWLESGEDISIDSLGNLYIIGFTTSSDFPFSPYANDTSFNGTRDAFVTKLSADGAYILYSSYLGGSDWEHGYGIALDPNSNVYVTGNTDSIDFYTTPGANNTTFNGQTDVFVVKLNLILPAIPPMIEAWEPGGTSGQTYTQGDLISVRWNASDDFPLPAASIDILYGNSPGPWTVIATNEINDRMYVWNTTGVPCDDTYWINVSVRDIINQTAFDLGNFSFDLDCPPLPPTIIATIPINGASDVALDEDVVIIFSESMDTSSFTYQIDSATGDPGGWTWTWSMVTTIVRGSHTKFAPLTTYTFNVTAAEDLDGDPLVPGLVPNPWNWTTIVDLPPTIQVFEPGGTTGQTYAQGDLIDITWTANDDNSLPVNPINITYGNLTAGWTAISTGELNDGTYSWDTASVPCPGMYWINISVNDLGGQTTFDESNYSFDFTCFVNEPPTIDALEPGGGLGQTYIQGDNIEVTWIATDDNTLPLNPINITYGDLAIGWTLIANNEANDGSYIWNTSGVPCHVNYRMNLTVYDTAGLETSSQSNYPFYIGCPVTLSPIIENATAQPDPQTVGSDVTITANVNDLDSELFYLMVYVNISRPDGTTLGNHTMSYNSGTDKFGYISSYPSEGIYSFVIWAGDENDNWDSESGTFVIEPKEVQEINVKIVIALVFAIILILVWMFIPYRRPFKLKDRFQEHRLKLFYVWVLPFVIAEIVTGVASLFGGALSVPPAMGAGMIVDLVILILGLVVYIMMLRQRNIPFHETEESRRKRIEEEIDKLIGEF